MYHLELEGSPYKMGRILGHFFKKNRSDFPIRLNKEQANHGKQSLHILRQIFPEASEEIRGITDTINFDHELFGSWLMCMGCCLTIRKNHNVEVRGCTAFGFVSNNKAYYGRDNDLPPFLKEVSKSIYYKPMGKHKFILNTSSFVNGEEGMNEHGLVAAMTFVVPKKDGIKPGLNSLFIVRYILENCKTVSESIRALKILPVASSCNILLIDISNEMVVAECNPSRINLRYPDVNKDGQPFIVTVNHFTSEKMKQHDRSNQNVYSSKTRYNTAFNAIKEPVHAEPILFIKELLRGEYGFMCQYKNIRFETIWSTVFDLENRKMYLSEGNPALIGYQDINLFN
ncbi:MAG TPA: C45 family peptidase [Bacteroidales bacterium]|nr:C45 family peptidase [Bacteroidales bacterium]